MEASGVMSSICTASKVRASTTCTRERCCGPCFRSIRQVTLRTKRTSVKASSSELTVCALNLTLRAAPAAPVWDDLRTASFLGGRVEGPEPAAGKYRVS